MASKTGIYVYQIVNSSKLRGRCKNYYCFFWERLYSSLDEFKKLYNVLYKNMSPQTSIECTVFEKKIDLNLQQNCI